MRSCVPVFLCLYFWFLTLFSEHVLLSHNDSCVMQYTRIFGLKIVGYKNGNIVCARACVCHIQ